MNLLSLPWAEVAIGIPLIGAVLVRTVRDPARADRIAIGATLLAFIASLFAWASVGTETALCPWCACLTFFGRPIFTVDRLSGPLLPLVALLHVLTVLSTSRVKRNRTSYTGHLIGEAVRLATFSCIQPWPLIALLAFSTIPPYIEMAQRGLRSRLYVWHMLAFVVLLVSGWFAVESKWSVGPILLLAAVLVRSGTFPAHLWVVDLFERVTFGTALLFATPIAGVYVALRLVTPNAPDVVLQTIGIASLVTAIYAAGLAIVQTDVRRFFAYTFLSHASIVLVGLELHTSLSLTGALGMWVSVALSLGGLGLCLRAVEARYGRLSLNRYLGLYEKSPMLAIGFLVTGFGCIGFPGTAGFIANELLVDGAIEANPVVGVALVFAAMLNSIAIVRVYLLLFTGTQNTSSVPLDVTWRERVAMLTLFTLIFVGGLAPNVWIHERYEAARSLNLFPEE